MPKSRGRDGKTHRRYIAKIRHNANVKVRQATLAVVAGQQAFAILMAVLGQSGGEVTVTKGTIDQVGVNLPRLGYVVVPGKVENEVIVRMTEQEVPTGPDITPVLETPTVPDVQAEVV